MPSGLQKERHPHRALERNGRQAWKLRTHDSGAQHRVVEKMRGSGRSAPKGGDVDRLCSGLKEFLCRPKPRRIG